MNKAIELSYAASKRVAHSLFTWEWCKRLLYWLIISAGTMSELVFLVASIWISVNASVHAFVLLFIDETTTEHITELATTAYVALPELILGLAFVVTIGHIRLFLYDRKNYTAIIWSVLYGLPTLVFLVLSLTTLGCSVLSVNFRLPEPLIVVRALAGYEFAFCSLLYMQLGVPQEKDRLQKKDGLLAALRQEKDAIIAAMQKDNFRLQEVIQQQKSELQESKELLVESKNTQLELLKAVNKSSDAALAGYSQECMNWLKSGVKTVSVDDINRFTGHSKRKIGNAITAGNLQTAPRNKELVLISSLVEWLKKTLPPMVKDEQDTDSFLRITGEMVALNGSQNGHHTSD